MALGLVAATAGYLAVFSLNDLLDRKVDERALEAGKAQTHGFDIDTAFLRHPLASGRLPLAVGLAWVGGLGVASAVCAYLLAPACLAMFIAAVLLEVIYCSLRSVTWAKTFVSGLMVGVGGLAGWVAVARLSGAAVSFFAFLALWEIAGRNLPNDLADLGPDRSVGLTTVATTFGPATSAWWILVGSIATPLVALALPMPIWVRIVSVALGVWAMLLPAVGLVREPTSARAGAYFNRASLLPALVFVAELAAVLVAR